MPVDNGPLRIRSLGDMAYRQLAGPGSRLQVAAVFDRVVYLSCAPSGSGLQYSAPHPRHPGMVVVTHPDIPAGPLNIALDCWPDWSALQPQMPLQSDSCALNLGGWQLMFAGLPLWNSRPDWQSLPPIGGLAEALHAGLADCAHSSAFLSLLCGGEALSASRLGKTLDQLGEGLFAADEVLVRQGAEELAGLGRGLTPAGDDFLCGLMIALWYRGLASQPPVCNWLCSAAAPRTTRLSAAFLSCAAAGALNQSWLDFIQWLPTFSAEQLSGKLSPLLAVGHSSGADMLAGFAWGLKPA